MKEKQGKYDAIVIGAGHNGLVTAAYLARQGRKVAIFEKRDVVAVVVTNGSQGSYLYI